LIVEPTNRIEANRRDYGRCLETQEKRTSEFIHLHTTNVDVQSECFSDFIRFYLLSIGYLYGLSNAVSICDFVSIESILWHGDFAVFAVSNRHNAKSNWFEFLKEKKNAVENLLI